MQLNSTGSISGIGVNGSAAGGGGGGALSSFIVLNRINKKYKLENYGKK
jgi:hypothetical protein